MPDVPYLLTAARNDDGSAADAAFSLLYGDLRRMAHSRLRQHQTLTLLDTTALVHDAYLKLVDNTMLDVTNRAYFFAYASRVMRSVIVDFARAKQAERRGGSVDVVTLDTDLSDKLMAGESDVLRINEALAVLTEIDARAAQVVEMRYFGGLNEAEIAAALSVSDRTVRRSWEKAKLLLAAELT